MRTALITGITGQTGSYLAEYLLAHGYTVHGLVRRSSTHNTGRVDHLIATYPERLKLHAGDVTDAVSVMRVVQASAPDEIYNLAGQSDVAVSFGCPAYTHDANALGPLHFLEALRGGPAAGAGVRFYQACTSEMFGDSPAPQAETTMFAPRSPYAAAKLSGYWLTRMYREAYGLYACNGILFNHESARRGAGFVTSKICRGIARIILGSSEPIALGRLDTMRDWTHAKDMVRGMHMMLGMPDADDYVLASGTSRSVREFVDVAFRVAQSYDRALAIEWVSDDTAIRTDTGAVVVTHDPAMMRPLEVEHLRGDATKAARVLGWKPLIPFEDMVRDMLAAHLPRSQMVPITLTPSGEIVQCPP